jgi:hypothetical protein
MPTYMPGAQFTKFVVIESLKPDDRKTGREIAHGIRLQLANVGDSIPVDLKLCHSRSDFAAQFAELRRESEHGHIPIIHVECHGSKAAGLEFTNHERLAWTEFAALLEPINVATGFNLLVLISACFGAYFVSMISAIRTSPCWALVAPSDKVYPHELESGFIDFYNAFVRHWDVGLALTALRDRPLTKGTWQAVLAEEWFTDIVLQYIRVWCSMDAVRPRIPQLQKIREKQRQPWISERDLRNALRLQNSQALDKYFARYFATDSVPSNTTRFAPVKRSAETKVESLRQSGNYLI